MAKPDLIELSTDWDNALLVADRYTGFDDGYVIEQSKRALAAMLLIANKEGRDYGWLSRVFLDYRFILQPIQRALRDGKQPDMAAAVEALADAYGRDARQRSDIFFRAYALLLKALQPRSAFDLDVFPTRRGSPRKHHRNPSADVSVDQPLWTERFTAFRTSLR